MDRFKVEKEVCLGCVLSPYLFNLYAVCCAVLSRSVVFNSLQLHGEYIMWNAGLDESQDGIKISGKNINLRYADDTSLMAESEEELKSLLMKLKKESEKAGLKLNIQKLFSWAPKSLQMVTAAMKWKDACSLKEKL